MVSFVVVDVGSDDDVCVPSDDYDDDGWVSVEELVVVSFSDWTEGV